MGSRGRIAAVCVAVTLLTSAFAVAGPGAPPTPAGAAVATNTDNDYATVEFSDPWDFSNGADFRGEQAQNLASYSFANGVLDIVANPGGGLIMAEAIAGAIPLGRSTTLHPIKANTLRKVSFRMYSFAGDRKPGGFFWYSCDNIIPACENGFAFTVYPGWNDYAFDIPSQGTFRPGGPAWAGTLKGLRLVPSGNSPVHVYLDYLRLVPSGGANTPPSPPVPLPVVDSPNAAGGADFATLVRRDPWDMSQPSDIAAPANIAYGFGGGLLNGINGGPALYDGHFYLPLAGPIDGNRFHRLSFSVFYEGSFGLGHGPGGGMLARIIWQTAGAPGVWQDVEDIVVYPGWNNVSVELATWPPWAITDPTTPNRIGWLGQQITAVRFDPHEDSGARRFLVDNIRIAEDATGYGGAYDIKFHDNAWRSGTTADIYVTNTRGGFGGTRIAQGLPVSQGVNTFRWAPNPLNVGTYWPYVVLRRNGATARAYATGPVRMTAAPSPIYGVDPFGALEGASAGPSGVRVRGWAVDPDTSGPIAVHFWVDGRAAVGSVTASGNRPDVQQAFAGFGADHGFNTVVPVPPGVHSLCAHAINTGAGTNKLLGCRTVNVLANPFGSLDVVRTTASGVTVRGWGIDPNTTGPITVHLYVQGGGVYTARANRTRSDLASAYPAYGGDHAFVTTLPRTGAKHTVCAYGINRGPGANALLGCRTG